MATAGCLEGDALWLDVGLHCRGRVSPPGEGRFQCVCGGEFTSVVFCFVLLIYKSGTACYNKSKSIEVFPYAFQSPTRPHNKRLLEFGDLVPDFLMLIQTRSKIYVRI